MISIHALREEGDQVKPIFVVADLISIHALREEGDPTCSQMARRNVLFLSTPSARRATPPVHRWRAGMCYFYPRPPRGGRHGRCVQLLNQRIISIHALREEGDSITSEDLRCIRISIHALREEGDM